ncbi:DNA-directed RNA polymerase [Metarhizium album ARSEF 1941]|uniref:DNA-directed RNA polymerase n=1 Tax=Metarhizium album (strain ARSEF 1941) TaxID=1081103 RepID=A0A0B2WWL8_METAS|nr:DNA-directed RNA polymerase [Metarhizium album ARSEF 1941]KHN98463.1 DNA-directed RNA polymerase [Metarhizium album ARSEF 1941]
MLSRQTRSSVLARRAATKRSFGPPRRLPSVAPTSLSSQCRRLVITRPCRPWRSRSLESSPGQYIHERSLATAIDDFKFESTPYHHLQSSSMPPFQPSALRSHDMRPFDSPAPLTIPEPGPPRSATKINTYGIPGDTEDMLPVFDACIRVGKLDRAALVLKRINATGVLSGEERIILNNQYLRASIKQMRNSPDLRQAEELHKWYELQIRSKGLPHTAETIACMLKASLLSERGSRLDRLVNRYMGMAPGESGLRVLSMDDVLSDQDLAVITEICPTYNFTVDPDEDVELSALTEEHAQLRSAEASIDQTVDAVSCDEIAEPLPTPQRGAGLTFLKKGLLLLRDWQDVDISKMSNADRRDIQLQLERDSIGCAIERWREANKNLAQMGIATAVSASSAEESLSRRMAGWLDCLEEKLKEEVALTKVSENKTAKSDQDLDRCLYGPLISQADPARLAALTILCLLSLGATQGADKGLLVSRLVNNIARLAQEDIETQRMERAQLSDKKLSRQGTRARRKVYFTGATTNMVADATSQRETATIVEDVSETVKELEDATREPWSISIRAQVGSFLLKTLIENAFIKVTVTHPTTKELISQNQPAFTHMQQPRRGKKVGVLHLNSHLVEQLKKEPIGDYIAKHLPMIAEPKPWRQLNEGGFLDSKTAIVRAKPGDMEQALYTKAAIKTGDMNHVFKGLDVLGKTAWRINKNVLNVMMEAWNTGKEIANMPPLNPELHIPEEPDSSADPLLRRSWMQAVKAIENERSGLHSQRCFMNLQLEVARAFRNQTMYFPHNVDYRGRAYPMPTYLNHMGADHSRAILKFAKGRALGERGLRWLKIHLANLYGLDKSSFDEREAFTDDNISNIIDSATNPLDGSRWWLQAEEAWQCLAACFELKAALELPDPTKFISHLPVHQDGTCNGLQHYAALGGDTLGAKQVNLEPGERPADVYSAVADLVKQAIDKDAKANNQAALVLQGKITRKVVKQTVMTNVYGVTFAGAKKQVCKQIDALYPDLGKECGIPNLILSTYIARHIFNALATMFRGAHDIQYWLGEVGGRVCRALTPAQLEEIRESYEKGGRKKQDELDDIVKQFRSSIVWTTPLRMPVVQPYRKHTAREIRTCLQAVVYPTSDQTDPVNKRKQLQGFPPNFIHSLDASHMLLSALRCHEQGLDFAAVHDSFWTHAADIDTMNGILREAFIRIHEEDVVGRLAAEFKARHKGSLYLAHLDPSSPVAKKIKQLRKSSKLCPKEELVLEHKRNSLRLSGNPWDLETAKKIVTPASVYEEMAGAEIDVSITNDLENIGLGEISQDEMDTDEATMASETIEDTAADDDGMMDSDDPHDAAAISERLMENMKMSHFETLMLGTTGPNKSTKRVTRRAASVPVWLPFTVPPVPKKGDFDVTRLRESKYFFS